MGRYLELLYMPFLSVLFPDILRFTHVYSIQIEEESIPFCKYSPCWSSLLSLRASFIGV